MPICRRPRLALALVYLLASYPACLAQAGPSNDSTLLAALADGHLSLARACAADGLIEEAIREWQDTLRRDPQREEAAKALGAIPSGWSVRWNDALHAKYLAYRARRAHFCTVATLDARELGDWLAWSGDSDGADRLWRLALEYAPDDAESRGRLDEARVEGVGWLPQADAERYAQGLLPLHGTWRPADEVRVLRKTWADAWVLTSDHFEITSNADPALARDLLAQAELMYAAVFRETTGTVDPPALEAKRKIHFYATLEDWDRHIREAHGDGPAYHKAFGFHNSVDDIAHFRPIDVPTPLGLVDLVRHEGAHQIVLGFTTIVGQAVSRPHFWAWEGFACWMESIEARDGKILLGDPRTPRLKRAVQESEAGRITPLAEFVQLDQAHMFGHYQQAAGLTHFFMTGEEGRWRARFLEYFRLVAAGQAEADTFEKVFGRPPADFEAGWRAFLKALK